MNITDFCALLNRYAYAYELTDDGVNVTHKGYVYLFSLTTLPEGTAFNNAGYVNLSSLTTLPEGTAFNNAGSVNLFSLTTETQIYRGKSIRLRTIDGYTMLMRSKRERDGVTIHSARYFGGGDLNKLELCFIAEIDDDYAHGDTIIDAIRDVRFKIAQRDVDIDDLVATIKARGTVEFNDFRLLTGACRAGLEHGMEQAGIAPGTVEMPLPDVLKAVHGPYGDAFRRLMDEAA